MVTLGTVSISIRSRGVVKTLAGFALLTIILTSAQADPQAPVALEDLDALHSSTVVQPKMHEEHIYYAFKVDPPNQQKRTAESRYQLARDVTYLLNLDHLHPLGDLEGYYVASRQRTLDDGHPHADGHLHRRALESEDQVLQTYYRLRRGQVLSKRNLHHRRWIEAIESAKWLQRQHLRRRNKREPLPMPAPPPIPDLSKKPIEDVLEIKDPLFHQQWHLRNDETKLHDLNVTDLWREGINGEGIRVGMIDDGLDYTSLDLKDNFDLEGSYDFNNHTKYPTPTTPEDYHGTRCAGEIAAVKNGICGLGIAYKAKISGLRILSGLITDVDEALSLNYNYQKTSIYSCSWGPADDGKAVEAPNELILDAMVNGIIKGRGGLGSIFVFATGNGGYFSDDCNFDGYTNSIYTISVGAIDHMERHPYYSEACSAQLVVAYSSGSDKYIVTTDRGLNQCTSRHGGTSAAAPLVSGVLALVLQVRPELTWRDMQHLIVQTAVPFSLDDPSWQTVAQQRPYSHKFGYGKIDGWAIVQAAKSFKLVNEQTWFRTDDMVVNQAIPQDAYGVNSTVTITQADLDGSYMKRLEHVTVTVNIDHEFRGDVEVHLVSPSGYVSYLATPRPRDQSKQGFQAWTFMSVKHWDENPVGEWTLRVFDQTHERYTGTLRLWSLILWGEATDASVSNPKGDMAIPKAVPSPTNPIYAGENQATSSASTAGDQPPGDPVPIVRVDEDEEAKAYKTHSTAFSVILGMVGAIFLFVCGFFALRWYRSRKQGVETYEFVPLSEGGEHPIDDSPRSRIPITQPQSGNTGLGYADEEGEGLVSAMAYHDYDDEDDMDFRGRRFNVPHDMYEAFGEDDDESSTLNQGSTPVQRRSGTHSQPSSSEGPKPTTPPDHDDGHVLFEISSDLDDEDSDSQRNNRVE
ncbi:pheromone processing endoprotease [Dispira parvispora]|uniref:Pheromone processing endoprotease n=1 Tax=Dispira parvispora TaxID=1520584 RepID=A0A9W8E5P0_9FUNG|nr:pheromone processing endoprotease [Dispira parvispora]